MRLVAFPLMAATFAAAQALPWSASPALPWRALATLPPPPASPTPSRGSLAVTLEAGGSLRVVDGRGIVRVRAGLPGRPARLWRDGGVPLEGISGTWTFPDVTPLSRNFGLPLLGQKDFRPSLEGLLWILDDDASFLTVLHPATGRLVYLTLPAEEGLELVFLPDMLVAKEAEGGQSRFWGLPWLGLLPQFIQLGVPPVPEKPGTALQPYPGG